MTLPLLFTQIERMRGLNSKIPITSIAAFLLIGAHVSISMKDVERKLQVPQASCNGYLGHLRKFNRLKECAGLDLIVATVDPENKVAKILTLTKQGEDLYNELTKERVQNNVDIIYL